MKEKIVIIALFAILVGCVIFASIFLKQYTLKANIQNNDLSNDENEILVDIDGNNKESFNNIKEENKEEMKMNILKLTSENFNEEVLNAKGIVLVDFYADWCGPCKMMAPVLEKIAEENPEIKIGKVNVDEEESLAIQYRIMSIPTFIIMKDGEVVNKVVGAVDKPTLEEMIRKN